MSKQRLEAFSDGLMAIIITIMVLNLIPPAGSKLSDLLTIAINFVVYLFSYIFIGTYWINHHHLLHSVKEVTSKLLWTNMLFLFFISLVPFATAWVADTNFSSDPVFFYGLIVLLTSTFFSLLQRIVFKNLNENLTKAQSKKTKISLSIHVVGLLLAFIVPLLAFLCYTITIIMWLVPDKQLEKI